MISHPPGAAGAQEMPSGRQLDVDRVPIGLEVGHAPSGERIRAGESGERRLRRRSGPGRVEEHDIELHSGRRRPAEGIGALENPVIEEPADTPA